MKKIIALALAVLMILTCLAGCGKSGNDNLANAVAYLENMYQTGKKDEPMKIESDKDVLSVVTVDGVTYNVEWTITVTDGASDAVKIAESETTNCVKIDVPELPESDVLFTATATVKDDKDNTSAATFSYKVFGLNIDNGDDTTSSEDGDTTSSEDGDTTDTPDDTTSSKDDTTSSDDGNKQLPVVTDQAKILKDAFKLGKNETTPYIAVLTGKVISITEDYNEQYGSVTAIMTVGGKNITCYHMKVGSVSGGSKVKPGDTITVKGVIKNFYYNEESTTGTVEFTWDEASQTEVVLTKLVVGKEETKKYTVVDSPVAGKAYKFGMIQENKSATDVYYLAGGMAQTYYLATTTSTSAAIDVYLEATNGGYYLYTNYSGSKQYINMVVNGTHVNGKFESSASTVYTFDATSKTLIATVNDAPYWFGTRNDKQYTTVGPCKTEYEGFYCKFYQ